MEGSRSRNRNRQQNYPWQKNIISPEPRSRAWLQSSARPAVNSWSRRPRPLPEAGVDVLEVTFTVPGAHRVLEQVADRLGDKVLLGAGSVLDPETARTAILAGAEFIVAPTINLDVIKMAQRYDKAIMPGAFTPTEILTAWEAGADVIKVFPSDITGPKYLKAIHGPLPQIKLLPTGGVNLDTAADFLKNGAWALGCWRFPRLLESHHGGVISKTLESNAKKFVRYCQEGRGKRWQRRDGWPHVAGRSGPCGRPLPENATLQDA